MITLDVNQKIETLTDSELKTIIVDIVQRTLLDLDQNIDPEQFKHMVERITWYIRSSMRFMPVGSINRTFELGVTGNLKAASRLNAAVALNWLGQTVREINENRIRKMEERDEDKYDDKSRILADSFMGKAMLAKLIAFDKGGIEMSKWDDYPIQKVCEQMKAGINPFDKANSKTKNR